LSTIAGLTDFRQEGPPADIGTFLMPTGVLVFQYTFAGTTYFVAVRSGERGWVLVDYGTVAATVINSAITLGSNEVTLASGTFTLTAVLTDNGRDNVTLAGMGKSTILYVANATQINAIYINGRTGWTLKDFVINGNKANNVDSANPALQHGIFVDGVSTDIQISGVTVRNTVHDGIRMGTGLGMAEFTGPQKVIVTECEILDCGLTGVAIADGIVGYGVVNGEVSNCVCIGTYGHGIIFLGSRDVVIEGNISNQSVGLDGICLYNCDYVTIQDNVCGQNHNFGIVISWSAGVIQAGNSRWVTIAGNVCYDMTDGAGIFIGGSAVYVHEQIVIADNVCRNAVAYNGIGLNYVTECVVSGNSCEANVFGIHLSACSLLTIDGNVVSDNTNSGIFLGAVTQATICGNVVEGNGDGIDIWSSCADFVVSGCIIYNNGGQGMLIDSSNDGTISDNTITDSGNSGIYLNNSLDIVIVGCRITGNAWLGVQEDGTSDYLLLDSCILRGNGDVGTNIDSAHSRVTNNIGYNPVGNIATPYSVAAGYLTDAAAAQAFPTSNTNYTVCASPKLITIYGGTVTSISIDGVATGLTSGAFRLEPGEVFNVVWTGQPSSQVYAQ